MQRAIVDLPQPDSPTIPERLPTVQTVKRDAVDRLDRGDLLLEDDPAGDGEVLPDVVDDEQLAAGELSGGRSARGAGAAITQPLRAPALQPFRLAVLRVLVEVAAGAVLAQRSTGWRRAPARLSGRPA